MTAEKLNQDTQGRSSSGAERDNEVQIRSAMCHESWTASLQSRCACCGPRQQSVERASVILHGWDTDLGGKLQARQRLAQMSLQGTDHDEHERFRVASEGIL